MQRSIKCYMKSSKIWQWTKAHLKPTCLLQPLEILANNWEEVNMDFISSMTSSNHGYDVIFVYVVELSKMIHSMPTITHVITA